MKCKIYFIIILLLFSSSDSTKTNMDDLIIEGSGPMEDDLILDQLNENIDINNTDAEGRLTLADA